MRPDGTFHLSKSNDTRFSHINVNQIHSEIVSVIVILSTVYHPGFPLVNDAINRAWHLGVTATSGNGLW